MLVNNLSLLNMIRVFDLLPLTTNLLGREELRTEGGVSSNGGMVHCSRGLFNEDELVLPI